MRIKSDNHLPGSDILYRAADYFLHAAVVAVAGVLAYGVLYL